MIDFGWYSFCFCSDYIVLINYKLNALKKTEYQNSSKMFSKRLYFSDFIRMNNKNNIRWVVVRAYLLIIEQRIRQWTNNSTKKLMISSYSTTKMVLGWPKMSSPSFWMILSRTSISQSRQNRCSTLSRSVTAMEMEGSRRRSWGSCIGSSRRDDLRTLWL